MTSDKQIPSEEATCNRPPMKPATRIYGSGLRMPLDDDPAGDGHMWSGKTAEQLEPLGDSDDGETASNEHRNPETRPSE